MMLRCVLEGIGSGSCTTMSLAEAVGCTPHELRAALDLLVERGYVERQAVAPRCGGGCTACAGRSCPVISGRRALAATYVLTKKGSRMLST